MAGVPFRQHVHVCKSRGRGRRQGTEVATTAFHMWHRGGMQTLWPRDEALERTRVVVEL